MSYYTIEGYFVIIIAFWADILCWVRLPDWLRRTEEKYGDL